MESRRVFLCVDGAHPKANRKTMLRFYCVGIYRNCRAFARAGRCVWYVGLDYARSRNCPRLVFFVLFCSVLFCSVLFIMS